MADIYNSDLIQNIINSAKIATSRDKVPNQLADKVVPVINVNPYHNRYTSIIYNGNSATTGSVTVATLPTGKEFYITYASIGIVKDAACDVANGRVSLTCVPKDGNTTIEIVSPTVQTLTAETKTIFISFPHPIRCREGTTIASTVTFTAGVCIRSIQVGGYFVETV